MDHRHFHEEEKTEIGEDDTSVAEPPSELVDAAVPPRTSVVDKDDDDEEALSFPPSTAADTSAEDMDISPEQDDSKEQDIGLSKNAYGYDSSIEAGGSDASSSEEDYYDDEKSGRTWLQTVLLGLLIALPALAIAIGITVSSDRNADSGSDGSADMESSSPSERQSRSPTSAPASPVTLSPTLPVQSSPSPSSQPSWVPTPSRNEEIADWIVSQNISSEADLGMPASPQQLALNWISDEDGLELPVPPVGADKTTDQGYAFLSRYVLAVFYYALDGPSWTYSLNF